MEWNRLSDFHKHIANLPQVLEETTYRFFLDSSKEDLLRKDKRASFKFLKGYKKMYIDEVEVRTSG